MSFNGIFSVVTLWYRVLVFGPNLCGRILVWKKISISGTKNHRCECLEPSNVVFSSGSSGNWFFRGKDVGMAASGNRAEMVYSMFCLISTSPRFVDEHKGVNSR